MGVPGLNEFAKYFYPQTNKEALIVDVRSNGGGNVSPMIIERLRRELVLVDIARNQTPQTNPGAMIVGPKVLLADEFSASDGDLVTWRFKTHKIGPVIGKRTWGGVVGISGTLPFLDGGVLNKPEFSRYDVAGKAWVIEGVGVEPDIFVDNDPAKEYAGEDQQLDKAIEVILDLLKSEAGHARAAAAVPDQEGRERADEEVGSRLSALGSRRCHAAVGGVALFRCHACWPPSRSAEWEDSQMALSRRAFVRTVGINGALAAMVAGRGSEALAGLDPGARQAPAAGIRRPAPDLPRFEREPVRAVRGVARRHPRHVRRRVPLSAQLRGPHRGPGETPRGSSRRTSCSAPARARFSGWRCWRSPPPAGRWCRAGRRSRARLATRN